MYVVSHDDVSPHQPFATLSPRVGEQAHSFRIRKNGLPFFRAHSNEDNNRKSHQLRDWWMRRRSPFRKHGAIICRRELNDKSPEGLRSYVAAVPTDMDNSVAQERDPPTKQVFKPGIPAVSEPSTEAGARRRTHQVVQKKWEANPIKEQGRINSSHPTFPCHKG